MENGSKFVQLVPWNPKSLDQSIIEELYIGQILATVMIVDL